MEKYRRHLLDDQGLAESTVVNYAWHVQKFLSEQFGEGAVNFLGLQAENAITFIRQIARGHSTRHAQLLVAGLRSFFRYLNYEGKIETDLALALPNVANWALSSLPKYIPAEAVQRVLDKCDRQTAIGRRDYALLLLLARLGMRGGEVLRLNLEDIDWQNASVVIRARKGPGWTQLPLHTEVGEAIAQYLCHDRPRCECRRVFLRARAPYLALSDTAVISSVVRRALKKAGVDSVRKGSHLFRHSLATDMLRHGASLNEIGELLRHRSPNSTAIYAKVELDTLRPLASCWPGGVR
jgi:integrase